MKEFLVITAMMIFLVYIMLGEMYPMLRDNRTPTWQNFVLPFAWLASMILISFAGRM